MVRLIQRACSGNYNNSVLQKVFKMHYAPENLHRIPNMLEANVLILHDNMRSHKAGTGAD